MERGRTVMFIDNSNIFQNLRCVKPGYRIDYKKLHRKIEEKGEIWETYFFAAEKEGAPRETQTAFFEVLKKELNYNIILTNLKLKTITCKSCGAIHETFIEKGVDVGLATKLISLLYNQAFDTAVVVSGDGDLAEVIREVRRLGRKAQVVSFRDSMSKDLAHISNIPPIYLDDIAEDIELERDRESYSYDQYDDEPDEKSG